MSVEEQQQIREKYFSEAMRYMDDAKYYLMKAQKDGDYYHDIKHVKMAFKTACNGLFVAMEGFVKLNGIKKVSAKDRKSIDYYSEHITMINKKMLVPLNATFGLLQFGYCEGITNVKVVRIGLKPYVIEIIQALTKYKRIFSTCFYWLFDI